MQPSTYSPTTATVNQSYQNLTQAFAVLHEEDPIFSQAVHTQHFERGQLIATADDLVKQMYVLMSGKVNMVCTNNEGRRLVIATLEAGAVFGEGAFETSGGPMSLPKRLNRFLSGWFRQAKHAI
ncbi:MAG: cyclic nucleotide-binding domain-containing protein [Caldilineaceae bacterium]